MKKLSLVFGLIVAFSLTIFAAAVNIGGPEITFEKDIHDFGKIKQHGNATYQFKFTNTGSQPLIINNCQGSCGCTVPEWPKTPIAPGASEYITVKYDSGRPGMINKNVTVYSNAVNSPTKVIRIKGFVETAQQNTAPTNNSPAPVAK